MKCEKCGFQNSEYDIICENCGSPLNIENNLELQKKYNHKQRAIDIEQIKPEAKDNTFDATRKRVMGVMLILIALIVILLVMIFSNILDSIKSKEIITQVDTFIENKKDGIIYLGNDEKASDLLLEYSEEYEYNYLFVNTSNITAVKRNKLKNKFGINEINNTVIILKDEKLKHYINNYKYNSKEEALNYLQENGVLPKYLSDPNIVINNFDTAISSKDPSIIYYVSDKKKSYDNVHQKLKDVSETYSLKYTFIEGYYLTGIQQLKLLKKLNYNEYHEEVLIIVDEGKVKGLIEKPSEDSNNDYFAIMTNYGIIDSNSAQRLGAINYNKMKELISSKSKNVILIVKDNCPYCDRLKPILGKISIQNDKTFYYYKISNEEVLLKYLKSIGLQEDKLSVPMVLITENNMILDHIIGYSEKSYYDEKLKELGVIR